jgi:hypothetical protein
VNNELVVEQKAIYSIEKFLIARRLMYWQVYLHKTVLSAETLLMHILVRAKELSAQGRILFATPIFGEFLRNDYRQEDFVNHPDLLNKFSKLDDSDVSASIKVWCDDVDPILSRMSRNLLERRLFKVEIQSEPFPELYRQSLIEKVCKAYQISAKEAEYFVIADTVNNSAYNARSFNINILTSKGQLVDVAQASDQLNLQSLSTTVTKHFICYPKDLTN